MDEKKLILNQDIMLVGIAGCLQSGKDTVAKLWQKVYIKKLRDEGKIVDMDMIDYRVRYGNFNNLNTLSQWKNKKFAYKLKQIVALIFNCNVEDLENEEFKNSRTPDDLTPISASGKITYRQALQLIGTDIFRNQYHPDIWVNILLNEYDDKNENWIISDCRFHNEMDAIKKKGGLIIKVIRGTEHEIDLSKVHASEIEMYTYKDYDYKIENNGTIQELETVIENIMRIEKVI
jgi:hypothetical protein